MVLKITVGTFCHSRLPKHLQKPFPAKTFQNKFKALLEERGYPKLLIERTVSEQYQYLRSIFLEDSCRLLRQKAKTTEKTLPFVTTYNPAVSIPQATLTRNWSFVENQPLLANILKEPPYISYKRGKSLKHMLVKAKL